MDDGGSSSTGGPSPKKLRRAYKACISCRRRKARCDLGGRDGPPCTKCRRELKECVFTRERSWTKNKATISSAPSTTVSNAGDTGAAPALHPAPSGPSSASRTVTSPSGNSQTLSGSNLMHSVVTTVVSSGNDALDLLFEAGSRQPGGPAPSPSLHQSPQVFESGGPSAHSSFDAIRMWESSKFVKMFWLSAQDLVVYVDFFVENMLPLSPVLVFRKYSYEDTHRLISQEPLLCVTILMIASRYCVLAGQGSTSKGYFVHERMWKSCQQLITRLMFGQERGPVKRARSIGSVEALLLLTEWHQRSLHFPPDVDGWESDAILIEDREHPGNGDQNTWIQDIIEPSRRSDRMSWMLIGAAMSLGYELNLFVDEPISSVTQHSSLRERRHRARACLHILGNQIASRFGTTSLPQSMGRLAKQVTSPSTAGQDGWEDVVMAWFELTRLLRAISEMVFPSKAHTQQLLRDGRYISLLEHFEPLLSQWEERHMSDAEDASIQRLELFVEYKYVRIWCNSIGMQAVCERAFADTVPDAPVQDAVTSSLDDSEIRPIQDVIDDSCALLKTAIEINDRGILKLFPVRIFFRISTASIFLLKALGIGARNRQLRSALDLLDKTVEILRSAATDDMHLAGRYSELLEMHVSHLRTNFSSHLRQTKPGRGRASISAATTHHQSRQTGSEEELRADAVGSGTQTAQDLDSIFDGLSTEDMLSLPFDPVMAPLFPVGDLNAEPTADNVYGDGFNLLWNFPS